MANAAPVTMPPGTFLRYVNHDMPGISRRRSGKGFAYRDPEGRTIRDKDTLAWIRSLAIPPAWTEVWIAPFRDAHLLAVGRDDRGRMQYRYHPEWRAAQDATKFERMLEFGRTLPIIRSAVQADLARPGLHKRRVLAVIVQLLEVTHVRVGNEEYAKTNKSYGLTTLKDRHLKINGTTLRFRFKGKSGKEHQITLRDRRLARLVGRLQDLPGQQLFQYLDEDGSRQPVDSADVNAYLREISGSNFTAKDFRTWAATVLCAFALSTSEAFETQSAAKRNLKQAIERVARRLGHTPTICRKSYIHPGLVEDYLAGELFQVLKIEQAMANLEEFVSLEPYETAVLDYLSRRLNRAMENADQACAGTLTAS
ncbi:DNA topoisomerase IB [Geminicoccus flavidas]|uniref:DNA topoisomerase IB n=1 Tax=Geminicoccus flavidas TaxID=2506407 RepID=UPI00135BE2D3|nr:DNA topoisomerase IB [Geminicoccus flavidas]